MPTIEGQGAILRASTYHRSLGSPLAPLQMPEEERNVSGNPQRLLTTRRCANLNTRRRRPYLVSGHKQKYTCTKNLEHGKEQQQSPLPPLQEFIHALASPHFLLPSNQLPPSSASLLLLLLPTSRIHIHTHALRTCLVFNFRETWQHTERRDDGVRVFNEVATERSGEL